MESFKIAHDNFLRTRVRFTDHSTCVTPRNEYMYTVLYIYVYYVMILLHGDEYMIIVIHDFLRDVIS